jgi:hypothetical protein
MKQQPKADKSGISRDDWLSALESAGFTQENDQGAITIPEFMAMMGLASLPAASKRLDTLVAQGKAKRTRKVAVGTDGRQLSRVAYRLLT